MSSILIDRSRLVTLCQTKLRLVNTQNGWKTASSVPFYAQIPLTGEMRLIGSSFCRLFLMSSILTRLRCTRLNLVDLSKSAYLQTFDRVEHFPEVKIPKTHSALFWTAFSMSCKWKDPCKNKRFAFHSNWGIRKSNICLKAVNTGSFQMCMTMCQIRDRDIWINFHSE